MEVISREEAKALGLKRYFTGASCKQGHVCERSVNDSKCAQCVYDRKKRWAESNRDHVLDYQRKLRLKNIDKVREYARSWARCAYAKNPDKFLKRSLDYRYRNLEKVRSRQKQWREENKDYYIEKMRAWHQNNKDRERQYAIEHQGRKRELERNRKRANPSRYAEAARNQRAKKPEKYRAAGRIAAHRRRVRRVGAEGNHTTADVAAIREKQKNRCAICRVDLRKVKAHEDHIIPISKGGSNWPSNIQLLCQTCNCRKSNKLPEQFARECGLLL